MYDFNNKYTDIPANRVDFGTWFADACHSLVEVMVSPSETFGETYCLRTADSPTARQIELKLDLALYETLQAQSAVHINTRKLHSLLMNNKTNNNNIHNITHIMQNEEMMCIPFK